MIAELIPKLAGMSQVEEEAYAVRPSLASPWFPDHPGRCIRALTYWRVGEPPAPWPGRMVLVLEDSSTHEDLTARWLERSAFRVHDRQRPVDIPLPEPLGHPRLCPRCQVEIPNTVLHGHIDGILTDPVGVARVYEHKAVNHWTFRRFLSGEELPLDYLTQGCLYLVGVRQVRPDVQEAIVLMKNKSTAAYLEYRFRYEAEADRCHLIELVGSDGTRRVDFPAPLEGLVTTALAKFRAVEAHAAAGTLPPRPYPRTSWQCGYCRWAQVCWAEDPPAPSDTLALLPQEVEALADWYHQARVQVEEGERVQGVLRPLIIQVLKAAGTQAGQAGRYMVRLEQVAGRRVDVRRLSPEARAQAEVGYVTERLVVRPLDEPKQAM